MAIQRRGWRDRLSGGLLAGIPAYGSAWAAQQQLGQAGERLELEKERHKESVLNTAATSVTERKLLPISLCISCVLPPNPLEPVSRCFLVKVDLGNILYSAVTHPLP